MESTICLLTEWTLKAGGLFKAESVFLIRIMIVKGAYAVMEDIAFHLEGKFGHAPKKVATSITNATLVMSLDVWKQTLVIRVAPCF